MSDLTAVIMMVIALGSSAMTAIIAIRTQHLVPADYMKTLNQAGDYAKISATPWDDIAVELAKAIAPLLIEQVNAQQQAPQEPGAVG